MIIDKTKIKVKGYLDISIDSGLDLKAEIKRLKQEKNAIILAHYYVDGDIQDIADFVGDSLGLSQQAANTKADVIVFAGVHFMAETAKILSPTKKVLLPDLNAGCSLADSAPTAEFEQFVKQHPDHLVISYVNTTAEIKALSDIICTSSNAKEIVASIPPDQKIIFGPDKNLGNYISSLCNREMLIWDGACHVHRLFSLPRLLQLKSENPDAMIIAHPECQKDILIVSEYIGSTAALLKFTINAECKKFIVATESGILHQMRKANPDKVFLAAPPEDATCACNDCMYMKLNTINKIYLALKYEQPEIIIEENLRLKALKPIEKMLEISAQFGL